MEKDKRSGQKYPSTSERVRNLKKKNRMKRWHQSADSRRPSASAASHSRTNTSYSASSQSGTGMNDSSSVKHTESKELPGFYFDQEKKKYFRIQPSSSGTPHSVTKEKINKMEAEKKRQTMLKEQSSTSTSHTEHISCTPKQRFRSSNVVVAECCRRMQMGTNKSTRWKTNVVQQRMSSLKTCSVRKIFKEPLGSDMYHSLEHMHAMETNKNFDEVLGLWSLSGTLLQRIQLLSLKPARTTDVDFEDETDGANCTYKPGLDVNPFGAVIKSLNKVTHICRAPMNTEDETSCVLYTTMCILGNQPSLALFKKLRSSTVEGLVSTEFNLGKNAAWTCAWNKVTQQFSVGSEKKAFLIDLMTRRSWEMQTARGDVLAQTFSNKNRSSLFSGTRPGLICQHDLRSSSRFITSFKHSSSVCHLHLLRDDNYLLASDFSGKIKMWDVRKAKVVMEYCGNKNEYSRIPFGVDETETIVYGAGQDCFTRIWGLQDGSLLHTIPPPYPASREIVPVLQYSDRWAGRNIPGLLMGIKDEIRFFSL